MSFATAGMTRGVRTHMPVSTQAFQNLGEHEENKANSLATLQKLAAAREMPQFKREYSTASSHWSNSGLVDLNAHGDRLTAPCNALNTPYKYNTHAPYTSISRPYLPYDRRMDACDKMQSVVYVNNVEAPTNTDAKKIVQQYVSTLPSESKEHTDTKAGKNTTCTNMKRTGMPTSTSIENPKTDTGIANIEKKMLNTDKDVQKLSTNIAQISKALDIMTQKQLVTDKTLQQTKAEHQTLQNKNQKLQTEHKNMVEINAKLVKDNASMKEQITKMQVQNEESTKKLMFQKLTAKNHQR